MTRRYKYGPGWREALIANVLGVALVVSSYIGLNLGARFGRRGVYLSPEVSVWVFIAILAAGLGWLVVGVFTTEVAITRRGEVVITPTLISAPQHDYSITPTHINPAAVTTINALKRDQRGEGTTIVTPDEEITLLRDHFQPQESYEDCIEAVRACVAAAHDGPPHLPESASHQH